MSTTAHEATLPGGRPAIDPAEAARRAQQRTWAVLIASFAILCAIVATTGITALTYRRNATDAPSAQVAVERGTVFYAAPGGAPQVRARDSMAIEEGGSIETGENSRASLNLHDGSRVRLMSRGHIDLSGHRIGKYNAEHTRVVVNLTQGAANFDVKGNLPFNREVVVTTPHGLIRLSKGDYLVWVGEDGTRVSSYVGQAKLEVGGNAVRISDGRRAVLPLDGYPAGPFPIAENLIQNGDFSRELRGWQMVDRGEPGRDDVGGVRALVEDSIAGKKVTALRISRDTQKDAHNETGITQEIRRDVSHYRSVAVSAFVKVNSASLSGGGYLGSEYPIMFVVNYLSEDGGRPTWAHGFFYANPQNRPVPIGEQIAQGVWFPYLGKLTDLAERPATINSIEILATGHDFDALVTEIKLLVE
jgi:ferric-dicitrate binding protein FerR (iron transport regulator)